MTDDNSFDDYERSLESLYEQADASAGMTLASTRNRRRNMVLLRKKSLEFAQFLDGDFTSIPYHMKRAFPSGYKKMPIRIINLLQQFVFDLATLYARAPNRMFVAAQKDAGGNNRLDPAVYQKFNDIYDRSGFDSACFQGSRKLVPQQTQVFVVLPSGPCKQIIKSFSPFEVFVTPGNALTASDIQSAAEVRIRAPVAAQDDNVLLGWMVFTPTECYWDADGTKRSIFNLTNPQDISNPWPGTIPLAAVHAVEPPPGCFIAPLADDLYHEQIGICLALSQIEFMARHSAPVKVIQPGQDGGLVSEQAEGLPMGADDWVALPGPGSTLAVIQPQPMIGEYRMMIDWMTGLLANTHNVAPDSFSKSPAAKTSVSRAYDRADRAETRDRYKRIFEPLETQLARLVARVSNLYGPDGIVLPEDVIVNVTYQEPDDAPADPVHAMQAALMTFRTGVDSPVDYLARQNGISTKAAEDKIRANLTLWNDLSKLMPTDAMNIDAPIPKADQ